MSRSRTLVLGLLATLLCAHAGASQYSGNMFLNGQYQNSIRSHAEPHYSVNPASNIFLEHAIISRQAQPFQGPTYLPPKEFLKCAGGQQCVRKTQCQGGFYAQQLPKIQNCDPETDVCCTYRPPPTTTTTTTTTPKPFVTCGRESDCVAPSDCRNGEIVAIDYIKKSSSNACYAPQVCCRMPSTTLTTDGYILHKPDKTFPLPTNPTVNTQPPRPQPTQPAFRPQPTRPNNEYLPPQTTERQTQPPRPQPTQPAYRPQPTQPQPQPTQPAYRPQPTQAPRPQPTQPAYRPQPTQPPRPQPTQPAYRPQPPQAPRPQPTQPAYRPQPTQAPRPQPTQPAYRPRPNNEYLPPPSKNISVPSNEIDHFPLPSNEQPIRGESILSPQIFPSPKPVAFKPQFAKCASALVCTEERFCNTIGVISETPVDLTPMEAAFRVPLTDCQIPESGAAGKCCRDPNYVDPWPVNLAGVCATRNKRTKPTGIKDLDANFAEIPWQAMVLQESTKSLLCGGAIIGDEFVLTAASCVKGVSVPDVRIKAGEWELGSTTEPLPFQLVGAKTIDMHPEYNPATGANDMAIIRLQKRFEFATHIQPICISDEDPSASEQCVTTGWGKQALQIHEEGAIMHVTNTSPLSRSDCGADGTSVCSSTKHDSCEFDIGSALACGSGSGIRLKGIYTVENACGENQAVRFSKPDVKWINTAFADRNKPLLLKRV